MKYSFSLKKIAIMPAVVAMVGIVAYARENNVVEEVAWVVGDEPIWRSQIEEAYDQYKYENTSVQGNPYCFIPERLAVKNYISIRLTLTL